MVACAQSQKKVETKLLAPLDKEKSGNCVRGWVVVKLRAQHVCLFEDS